nr:MAG TPA: Major capsid protein [Caudoviricetes sp.]
MSDPKPEEKTTVEPETRVETKNDPKPEEKKTPTVDVEKVKSDALSEFVKSLGVEDTEKLKQYVNSAREAEQAGMTELEKANTTLTATTKALAEEKEARTMAEAKLSAIKAGVKPELVDDVVLIAKTKVTAEKTIDAVIAEMKDSNTGKFYFEDENEEPVRKTVVTRKKPTENKGEGKPLSRVERMLQLHKEVKSHYFK